VAKEKMDRPREREREELLELMEKAIPPEVLEAIELVVALPTTERDLEVKVSHRGTIDADFA
jgi:hypothetical protein